MYFVLSKRVGLRSWKYVPQAYYVKGEPLAKGFSREEFEILLQCDGAHRMEPSALTESLQKRGLIRECAAGEAPTEWSTHKRYDHRYFPRMNLMITGRCNYNCLHCFNAADRSPLMTEWKFHDLLALLDQARECGVNAVTLTA